MQIPSRFTIAIHIFACIDTFKNSNKITSEFLASSINVNPVIIRKNLSMLRQAELITVQRGSGGADIAKPPEEITLLDIFNAVDCLEENTLFHFHDNPNPNCPVGRCIHSALDGRLTQIQAAMENEMKKITLADVLRDMRNCIG